MSSLTEFLNAFDEVALAAASSKGVVLRAAKDVVAGGVTLDSESADEAQIRQGGEVITLSRKGLNNCRCSCPATGICRHIVAAVLFLREQGSQQQRSTDDPAAHASEPVFTLADIERFARSDWPLALALTDTPANLVPGASPRVVFPETGETVTFPHGQPLAEALFKGPRSTRKRRVIAAAALILLRHGGASLPEHIEQGTAERKVDPRILDLTQAALRQAAVALAAGQVLEAGNRLFTLAISARTEAIPRLAASLRSLSERLEPDRLRRVDDRPEALLAALADCHALAEALRTAPADTRLTGTFSRSFAPCGPRVLYCLGARHWQNPSGARGFTITLFDPVSGQFHTGTEARGAGTDMGFEPEKLWGKGFWGAGTAPTLAGHEVLFEDLLMAPDGALSLTQNAKRGNMVQLDSLLSHATAIQQWADMGAYLRARQGASLRRHAGAVYALVVPDKTAQPAFDPIRQTKIWTWFDKTGFPLTLSLPDKARPGDNPANIAMGLVILGGPHPPELVSVWPEDSDAPLSLQNKPLPQYKQGWRDKFKLTSRPSLPTEQQPRDPLALWFDRAIEAVLIRLAQRHGTWPPTLLNDAESLGLHSVTTIINQHDTGHLPPESALRLAYFLNQARIAL